MVDATLGTICRLKALADSGRSPRRLGRRPETQIRNTPSSAAPQWLLNGSKRDGCVVRNFADVLGVAHEATQHRHARCPTVCLGHRGKPPAVDESLHAFCLAPSTRHDPHSCAHAQLNGRSPSAIPFVSGVSSGNGGFEISKIQGQLCKQVPDRRHLSALGPS
jgi:hypothetical protein